MPSMAWEVEHTDELETWWLGLDDAERESIRASGGLLEERGLQLDHPHSSKIGTSAHTHMRELRVQHRATRTG